MRFSKLTSSLVCSAMTIAPITIALVLASQDQGIAHNTSTGQASSALSVELLKLTSLESAADKQTSQSCQTAVNAGRDRLRGVRGVQTVRVEQHDISQDYPDYPAGRPYEYVFLMRGSATGSVLNSPVLMSSITNNIFQGCGSAGMVSFALEGSGYFVNLGWSPNGAIVFECSDDDYTAPSSALRWGEQYCNI